MKKTNGRRRTNPHNSGTKPKLTREATRKETNNKVNKPPHTNLKTLLSLKPMLKMKTMISKSKIFVQFILVLQMKYILRR